MSKVDEEIELAQFIRQVNGDNKMGAARLAEAIIEWQAARDADSCGWIRCDERLPTFRDSDHDGNVWVVSEMYGVKKMGWSAVRCDFESHWMPTGLTRPQTPTNQEADGE